MDEDEGVWLRDRTVGGHQVLDVHLINETMVAIARVCGELATDPEHLSFVCCFRYLALHGALAYYANGGQYQGHSDLPQQLHLLMVSGDKTTRVVMGE